MGFHFRLLIKLINSNWIKLDKLEKLRKIEENWKKFVKIDENWGKLREIEEN